MNLLPVPAGRGRGGSLQFPGQPSDRSAPLTPEDSSVSAPGSQIPSMAFTHKTEARLPLGPALAGFCDDAAGFASCYGPAGCSPPKNGDFVIPLRRWDLSARRESATGDPGVSPDRTHTGWLP